MSSKESHIGAFTNKKDSLSQCVMQLATTSVLPMKAAIELGVLEILDRAGPGALLSTSQIASQLPTHNNQDKSLLLDCMLKLLASHSILTCSVATHQHDSQVSRLFGPTPISKYFIKNKDEFGGSLAPFLDLFQDKYHNRYHLTDAILEGGIPFSRAYGMEANDFEGLKLLVDVGGGDGTLLNMIISKYPILRKSIEHIAGDMFWVLHHWDEKQCLKLYSFLMNTNPERKERTEREFQRLAKEARFSGIQVACCAYNFSVVEFYKNM
ncbi:hypothetical protein ACJW31_01G125900 [Castanea mollissima]